MVVDDYPRDKPLISIVMPCYNSESSIESAVHSVRSQTYANWELILVDDGSTDKTPDIADRLASYDNRIRCVHKANGGYATAINTGLCYVTGSYFMMLGSDDFLSKELFLSLFMHLVSRRPDCVAFQTMLHRTDESAFLDPTTSCELEIYLEDTDFRSFSCRFEEAAKIFHYRDTSKLFSSKLLAEGIRFFGRYGYDSDCIFSLLCAHASSSFLYVPVVGYHWMLHPNSVSSSSKTMEMQFDRIYAWDSFLQRIVAIDPVFRILTNTEKEFIYQYLKLLQSIGTLAKHGELQGLHGCVRLLRRYYHRSKARLRLSERLFLTSPRLWILAARVLAHPKVRDAHVLKERDAS